MTLTRRSTLLLAAGMATAALVRVRPAVAQAATDPAQARAFVEQAGRDLVAVVNGPGTPAQKQRNLQPIIDRVVDVNGVARFCLGRYWRVASPAQREQYEQLFHTVLMNNITGRLGEFQGVRFTVTRTAVRPEGVEVYSVVARPNNPPADVIWVVGDIGGQPKIIDVVAEGTSLRLTQRSDYASYLARNGDSVTALIAAMRRQVGA